MSGVNRIASRTYTVRELAARVVDTGLLAQRTAGTTRSARLRLWIQPAHGGRVHGVVTLAEETAEAMGPERVAKFEQHLLALGWVRVGKDGKPFPIGVEGFTREQDEDMVAKGVAASLARFALDRAQRASAELSKALASVRRAADAAPGGDVLGEADYDEHLRLVVARALGLPGCSAVAALAGCERLLWRKGRLTAERGAALLVAFRGVVDRDADLRRN